MNKNFEVTKVDIFPINPQAGLIAFASVKLNDTIQLGSIGVRVGEGGKISITLPAKKVGEGMKFYFSLTPELKDIITEEIQKNIDSSGLFGFIKEWYETN